ncbi:MAG: CHAT domain-containing protein [Bacteroidales bacterium]|nr:CHAT domain-containing protein [Bacteroidales bacterium]
MKLYSETLGFSVSLLILILFSTIVNSQSQELLSSKAKMLDSLAKSFNNRGVDIAVAGDIEKAGIYFKKALDLKQLIPGFSKTRLASGYLNLANIKQQLKSADSALIYYKKAEGLINQVEKPSKNILGTIYVEMGDCYLRLYDVQTAISFIKKGIRLIESDSIPDSYKLILSKLKLTSALRTAGFLSEALSNGEEILNFAYNHQSNLVYAVHNNLGITYMYFKDYQNALLHFKASEEILKNAKERSSLEYVGIYTYIGLCYQKLFLVNEAESYYNKALGLSTSINSIISICQLYNYLGDLKFYQGLLDQAERLFLKSKSINTINSNDFFSLSNAAYSFKGFGDIYARQSLIEKDRKKAVESLKNYKKAISLSEDIRFKLFSEDDKLLISGKYNDFYDKAIESAFQFSASIDSSFLTEAFMLISKSKAAILHELISKNKGLSISGVPIELQNQEQQIKQRFDYLTEKFYEERKLNSVNVQQVKRNEEQLFNTQNEYRAILKEIETNYPKYYKLKYDTSSVSIQQLQKTLPDDKLVIDYYKTDSNLYSFAISKCRVIQSIQKLDSTFYNNLAQFRAELVPNNFSSLSIENVKHFSSSSYYLYSVLLKPYENEMKGKKLIIVPHNELISIPFAALVTKKQANPKEFFSLPYLVNDYPISYSLSSKLLTDQVYAPKITFIKSISIAPSYKGKTSDTIASRSVYRQDLWDLPGAKNEAVLVSKRFKGALLLDRDATESRFKSIAGNYDIIHLAMHTFIDDKNPNFSKLIFTKTSDSINDGYLNAYEIFNLKLKSRLTIISACRSGDGNLIKGEGIISLARGFFYAGCPSLVTTQWRVDDSSGTEIIIDFSKYIKKGESISVSLQLAQKNFIKKADPLRSHPYFWAAYQVLGSDNPVTQSGSLYLLILGVAVCLVFIVAVSYYKFIK